MLDDFVSNDDFDNLLCFLLLIIFVLSPHFTESFLVEEGELELGLLRGIEGTSTLTD